VGSSWYAAEISGVAPIRSPAATTSVFLFTSDLRWVARYAAPPASTVAPVSSTIRPPEPLGGSRLPWKSLIATSRTGTVWAAGGLGGLGKAVAGPAAIASPAAATPVATAMRQMLRGVVMSPTLDPSPQHEMSQR